MLRKVDIEKIKAKIKLRNEKLDEKAQNANRQFFKRLRESATETIEGLTELAQILPSSEFEQIYINEVIFPLIKEFFRLEIKAESHEGWIQAKETREMRRKRKRVLQLAQETLFLIGNHEFLRHLLPEQNQRFIHSNPYSVENYKLLLYASI